MERDRQLKGEIVRFQWAIKHLLNQSENFDIMEEFVSSLLQNQVKIIEVVDGFRDYDGLRLENKSNRIFFKGRNENDETILIQIQTWQKEDQETNILGINPYYLYSFIDKINKEETASKIKKCYSISVLYGPFGAGDDYVYKAERVFRGIESNTELVVPSPLSNIKDEVLANEVIHEIYLVLPDKFGQIPTDTFEEWMVYLNDGTISPGTKAPGLRKALKSLRVNTLSNEQLDDYLDYRLESVKSDLENKVDKLLLPLERLDEGMGKRYVKKYSQIYSEGYEAGLDLACEKGISDEEAKSG